MTPVTTNRALAVHLAAIVEQYTPTAGDNSGETLVEALERGLVELGIGEQPMCGAPGHCGFNCTLEAGHASSHLALDGRGRAVESWPADPLAGENPGPQATAPAADESEVAAPHGVRRCYRQKPHSNYACSRPAEHSGDHIQHSLFGGTELTRWPQEAPDAR